MKVLQILESAYRATVEEQDDTVIWLTHTLKGAGASLDVLLTGNSVNYILNDQDASGLAFGAWRQTQPARLGADLAGLIGKGVKVYYLSEDAHARGIGDNGMVTGVIAVNRSDVPGLLGGYDQVWCW
jgi:hypothetical protein